MHPHPKIAAVWQAAREADRSSHPDRQEALSHVADLARAEFYDLCAGLEDVDGFDVEAPIAAALVLEMWALRWSISAYRLPSSSSATPHPADGE